MKPKILLYDIETAPLIISTWGVYQVDAIEIRRDWFMLSFAYQWQGSKKIVCKALPDYPNYRRNKQDDKALVTDLYNLFCEADYAIAHNGDKFDLKKVMARIIYHGLPPPSPFVNIDTLKIMRNAFGFSSNRLDAAAQYLGVGRKLAHTGKDMWRGCEEGDPKAWAMMKRYNVHDVFLLNGVDQKIKPYAKSYPDLTVLMDYKGCPVCQSSRIQRRGPMTTAKRKYHRLHCQDCGHWFRGETIKPHGRLEAPQNKDDVVRQL